MFRKGQTGNQLMVGVFLLAIVIVVGSLVYGISGFFGAKYDFRGVDATILNEKVENCLSKIGRDFDRDNFFEKCGIEEKVVSEEMLLIVVVDGEELVRVGRGDETQCGLGEKNEQFIKCVSSSFIVDESSFNVISGSNQDSKGRLI